MREQSDPGLFQDYARLINPQYPQFLQRLGLSQPAVRAEGAWIEDAEGNLFLDCVNGFGLFALGHNHPRLIYALKQALEKKTLNTRPLVTAAQVEVAKSLERICPGDLQCSFLTNSGSEAVDTAMKLARLHSGKKRIICAEKSFHGYTFGALSASGFPRFKQFFQPMLPEVVHVPYGDIRAVLNTADKDTAAVLLEPMQHEGGVLLPGEDYLSAVRRLCSERDIVFILDEIKTGLGRTGAWFACQEAGAIPDVLILGKALGGGIMPAGAVVATRGVWKKFGLSFPMSASSFAGNALTCTVAVEVIDTLQEERLVEHCAEKGKLLLGALQQVAKNFRKHIVAVRGKGLLVAVGVSKPGEAFSLAREMIARGILVLPAFGNSAVVMIEPPLVITANEIERIVTAFEASLVALAGSM